MLILASKSPRRKELLSKIYHEEFKIIPSNAREDDVTSDSLYSLPLKIALKKGMELSREYKEDVVLSSDTIVIFNNKKFGKPKDEDDASRMLRALNETKHDVVTSYCLIKDGKVLITREEISSLILHNLNEEAIDRYIKTLSPFDKAGAYGIQDEEYISSTIVKGYYSTVMGLPIEVLQKDLESIKNLL